jgi:phage replication O-like protein O
MVSPQLENGYTSIANEIMDALCRIRIPGEARQVLTVILRKTYGWNKKEDVIPLSQFVSATGMKKTHVVRSIYMLRDMNLIITKKDNSFISYCFNKDYSTWKPLPKRITSFIKESIMKNKCYLCGFSDVIERHHIISRSDGGSNKISNLINLCPNCHSLTHKGKYNQEILFSKKITVEGVPNKDNVIEANDEKPLPKKGHSKENTKETTKENKDNGVFAENNKDNLSNMAEEIHAYIVKRIGGSWKLKTWKDKYILRLKNYTIEECKLAIDGFANSKWHLEKVSNRAPELIFRSDKCFEEFLEKGKNPELNQPKEKEYKRY